MFLEESISYFQFSIQADFSLFEIDPPIDQFVVVVIVWIQTPEKSHKEQYQNSSSPNLKFPRLLQLRVIIAELLARPIQLSVQGFLGDFACLSMIAQRFDLDLSSP